MAKIKINYIFLFFLAIVALAATLFSTRYDYGSNIFGRYCRGNDFYTKPVCIEATQKRIKSLQSEEFKAQDYYYLSVTLPITKYSYDFKNPVFSGSITFSQFGYAMSNAHFYVDALIIFVGLFLLYFLFRLPFIYVLFRKLFFSDFYWHNKDVYFEFLNCPDFEATEHWQLDDELAEHKIYIVHGDYGTTDDMAVLQLKNKDLMKNPQETIKMIQEIFKKYKFDVVCVGNEHPQSIWGKRQW